jgi:peptidoglycan/LPS O-acetylase OafA/YrhL
MAVATYIHDPLVVQQPLLAQPKYRPDIDGLRGIAVLAVVAFHAFPALCKGGFIGVDVFFVISGYLISGIILNDLERQKFSFASFYARRIKRIFPPLILVLAACFVFGWFTLLEDEYQSLGKQIAGGAGFAANFVLWNSTDYFYVGQRDPLLHLWSLGVEEQFYLVWPMVLWLLWRKRTNFPAIVLLIGLSSFAVNILAIGGQTANFYLPASRLWELLLGGGLAYQRLYEPDWPADRKRTSEDAPGQWERRITRNLVAAAGILLIATGIALINQARQFPGWWALLPTAGTGLILFAGPESWFSRHVLSNRVLVWIGLISYPLYLWHWPLLSFVRVLAGWLPGPGVRVALVLLSIALAALTYILIEKPIRFGGNVRVKVAVLCVSMLFIGCAGYSTYRLDGLPFRGANAFSHANLSQLAWFGADPACLRLLDVETEHQNRQAVFCSLRDDLSAVRVAIFGDSTSNALYPGFQKVFGEKQIGVIDIGNGTCAPFRGLHGSFDWNTDCTEINDKFYDFLLKNPQIKIVVLGLAAWDIKNMRLDGLPKEASLETKFSMMAQFVDRDVTALASAGKKVVLTYDSPLFPIDPRTCVRRSTYLPESPRCIFSEGQLVMREPYISLWRTMLAKHKDICVFEQSPHLKSHGRFNLLSPEGILLYRDDEHLSYFGSERIAREFVQSACAN